MHLGQRAAIEDALGYHFANRATLNEALTHASASRPGRGAKRGRPSYERLEFLGDRVVGLIVAHLLIEEFPDEPEGALSPRHDALVRREMLAEIAIEIGINEWLELAAGEQESGGRGNPSILADCCEALIGALYLDGGYKAASAFVRRYWLPRIARMGQPPRDPKTELQEWAHAQKLPLPDYQVLAHSGPAHAPTFEVEVTVQGKGSRTSVGRSKRLAEQTAAQRLLADLRDTDPDG
ncbi:MAG: ribonuclease III [Pseudomonadota bacterium]